MVWRGASVWTNAMIDMEVSYGWKNRGNRGQRPGMIASKLLDLDSRDRPPKWGSDGAYYALNMPDTECHGGSWIVRARAEVNSGFIRTAVKLLFRSDKKRAFMRVEWLVAQNMPINPHLSSRRFSDHSVVAEMTHGAPEDYDLSHRGSLLTQWIVPAQCSLYVPLHASLTPVRQSLSHTTSQAGGHDRHADHGALPRMQQEGSLLGCRSLAGFGRPQA